MKSPSDQEAAAREAMAKLVSTSNEATEEIVKVMSMPVPKKKGDASLHRMAMELKVQELQQGVQKAEKQFRTATIGLPEESKALLEAELKAQL